MKKLPKVKKRKRATKIVVDADVYDALVKELRDLVEIVDDNDHRLYTARTRAARAVLAKVEGKSGR